MDTTDASSTKVLLYATDSNNKLSFKCTQQLLTSKKLKSYHIHVTCNFVHDEEFLSDIVIIKELNKRLFCHPTDVTSDEAVKSTIEKVIEIDGKIDILVCQMDKRTSSSAAKQTTSSISLIYEQNFYPHVRFISKTLPHMKKCNAGKIIVTNTFAGLQGLSYSSAYCAARFALEGFLESVAAEVASYKICVSIIETVLAKEEKHLISVNDQHELSDLDRELISRMESDLEKKKLLKDITAEKLTSCVQSLATSDNPDIRIYLNKSCQCAAKEKFIDPRGLRNLSEVTKFFLNIDIEEVRGKSIPYKTRISTGRQTCSINLGHKLNQRRNYSASI